MASRESQQGFALVTVLLLAGMLTALLAGYFFLTRAEILTTRSSLGSNRGFYAAEAGLNIRAETIRAEFLGYNRPSGVPPTPTPGGVPCRTGDPGSGDFACTTHAFVGRDVLSYIVEDAANPSWTVIPPGEPFQNLNAQVYAYGVRSIALNGRDEIEAILDLQLLARLVPLFQFAAFYDKDLEILPGPAMTLAGPVHTNGDLYLDAGDSLTIEGQVTTTGRMFNGRKDVDSCTGGDVAVFDPAAARDLPACGATRSEILEASLGAWNGMIRVGSEEVQVPPPETLDPNPGAIYWDRADLHVMLNLHGASPVVELRNADDSVHAAGSTFLETGCGMGLNAADSSSGNFYNFREATSIEMLEIDVGELLDCIEVNAALMGGKLLDDTTEGGLVWYFGVDGPDESVVNNYGVRLTNGDLLAPSVGATEIKGLTVVTDQALYVEGDYNSDATAWKPAAFLADSLNVLSNSWDDVNSANTDLSSRTASSTRIFAAFLGGTDATGDVEGVAGQDSGDYNGGLENYPRFHETWSSATLTYRGSFVSLDLPRHVDGPWTDQSYSPPTRDWGYELRFNDAANLPPLSPRFVYLRQDQFLRRFDPAVGP